MDVLGYCYAGIITFGGIFGYVKAGSLMSLGMGVLFGASAAYGSYLVSQDPKNVWVLLVTSGVLMGVMGSRFYNSGKIMPAGLVFALSLLTLGRMAIRLYNQ